MSICKRFAEKFPIVTAALTIAFLYALLMIADLFPAGPLADGISRAFLAAAMFGWTFLLMGKEKVSFHKDGFGYSFRFFKAYLIILTVFSIIVLAVSITGREISENVLSNILNALLVGATVGIVEEFSFRGLVFGGILQKIGNSKKSIITAAVTSGFLFGAMHIIGPAIRGEISSPDTMITAALKTCQAGVFGIIVAFIYYKTRNLFAVAALHGLNDMILYLAVVTTSESVDAGSYVGSAGHTGGEMGSYIIFTLIMTPMLVKCIRDVREKEAIPFDDDFLPRAVFYEKRQKKARIKKTEKP